MYAGEIHNLDRELGRVLEFLDRSRQADRTAVVVIADHGESLGEHEIFFDHRGLYETQLHVPFLLRVPGFPAGLRPVTTVSQLDVAPTLAELFGVSLEHELRGSSLVPLLRGEPSEALEGRRWLVHESNRNAEVAVRSGRWKLIWPIEREGPATVPQLFDLEADPAEANDLSRGRRDVVADLSARLRPWIAAGAKERHHEVADSDAMRRLKALGYVR
jgi:arylsulfatase A-like enzyme